MEAPMAFGGRVRQTDRQRARVRAVYGKEKTHSAAAAAAVEVVVVVVVEVRGEQRRITHARA